MKYLSFSFDDSRLDTYKIALPILQKYNMVGTVNVISDFVVHPDKYHFETSPYGMSVGQVLQWQNSGGEIASHGSTHQNSSADIIRNVEELKDLGINVENIGFASPGSWLTETNLRETGIDKLLEKGVITYIRSGIQIRREGLIYMGLSVIEKLTHNKHLFYQLNKRCIIKKLYIVYPSVAIKDYTSLEQVKYIINKTSDNEGLILMFHSILPKDNPYYGKDHYYWDADKFEKLCEWLSGRKEIIVLTTKNLIDTTRSIYRQ